MAAAAGRRPAIRIKQLVEELDAETVPLLWARVHVREQDVVVFFRTLFVPRAALVTLVKRKQ